MRDWVVDRSDIWRSTPGWLLPFFDLLMRLVFLSPAQGAATSIAAAACTTLPPEALYLTPYKPRLWGTLPWDFMSSYAAFVHATPRLPPAPDAAAMRLWNQSARLVDAIEGQGTVAAVLDDCE